MEHHQNMKKYRHYIEGRGEFYQLNAAQRQLQPLNNLGGNKHFSVFLTHNTFIKVIIANGKIGYVVKFDA